MDFWTALFLFLAGALSHKLGSYIFMETKKLLYYNDCAFGGLRIFRFIIEAAEMMHNFKHEDMEKNNLPAQKIEEEKEKDRKMIGVWKEIAITGIREMLPHNMRSMLRFNNWEEAMRLLNNRDKKE